MFSLPFGLLTLFTLAFLSLAIPAPHTAQGSSLDAQQKPGNGNPNSFLYIPNIGLLSGNEPKVIHTQPRTSKRAQRPPFRGNFAPNQNGGVWNYEDIENSDRSTLSQESFNYQYDAAVPSSIIAVYSVSYLGGSGNNLTPCEGFVVAEYLKKQPNTGTWYTSNNELNSLYYVTDTAKVEVLRNFDWSNRKSVYFQNRLLLGFVRSYDDFLSIMRPLEANPRDQNVREAWARRVRYALGDAMGTLLKPTPVRTSLYPIGTFENFKDISGRGYALRIAEKMPKIPSVILLVYKIALTLKDHSTVGLLLVKYNWDNTDNWRAPASVSGYTYRLEARTNKDNIFFGVKRSDFDTLKSSSEEITERTLLGFVQSVIEFQKVLKQMELPKANSDEDSNTWVGNAVVELDPIIRMSPVQAIDADLIQAQNSRRRRALDSFTIKEAGSPPRGSADLAGEALAKRIERQPTGVYPIGVEENFFNILSEMKLLQEHHPRDEEALERILAVYHVHFTLPEGLETHGILVSSYVDNGEGYWWALGGSGHKLYWLSPDGNAVTLQADTFGPEDLRVGTSAKRKLLGFASNIDLLKFVIDSVTIPPKKDSKSLAAWAKILLPRINGVVSEFPVQIMATYTGYTSPPPARRGITRPDSEAVKNQGRISNFHTKRSSYAEPGLSHLLKRGINAELAEGVKAQDRGLSTNPELVGRVEAQYRDLSTYIRPLRRGKYFSGKRRWPLGVQELSDPLYPYPILLPENVKNFPEEIDHLDQPARSGSGIPQTINLIYDVYFEERGITSRGSGILLVQYVDNKMGSWQATAGQTGILFKIEESSDKRSQDKYVMMETPFSYSDDSSVQILQRELIGFTTLCAQIEKLFEHDDMSNISGQEAWTERAVSRLHDTNLLWSRPVESEDKLPKLRVF
ncbi:MAG: hypothetical protein M1829_003606 [Trizodia sp. TS-e1964]|nr:MAG: hypothetical protein M1829_003606 [Trizodia sp. TS-e1964]